MQLLRTLQYKAASGLVLVLMMIVINFFLLHLAPGDIAETLAGEMSATNEAFLQSIRTDFGLDKPLLEQLGIYVTNVMTFQLGESFYLQKPVLELFMQRAYPTLLLVSVSAALSFLWGVFLGFWAAYHHGKLFDTFLSIFAVTGSPSQYLV